MTTPITFTPIQNLKNIDASTIILGFTGSIGSGCTYISEMVHKIGSPRKFRYYKLSDTIRKIFELEGVKNPSIQQLQDKGNELRRLNQNNCLIAVLLNQIDSEWNAEEDCGIIIDGIKNTGEVNALRHFPYFFLFSVHATREIRCDRVISAGRFHNETEFNHADLRDRFEEYEYGQQVTRCSDLSDVVILNDNKIPGAAKAARETFIRDIYNRYIKLIEDLHGSTKSPDNTPTIDELCMTIAYALSKSSSCLKRKVGCVVIDVDLTRNSSVNVTGKSQLSYPFIISSGYNEVPLGSYPCIYHPGYEKCYRDYLQEEYAKTLKYCPACGKKIQIDVRCPVCNHRYSKFIKTCEECHREIDFVFSCTGCNKSIFDFYVPGNKGAPGKLLDMCRALHAEETALLKLTKTYGKTSENLVLYSTTQPCNLCSNKIVLSGIRKVVYSEPYSMKEADEILKSGNVAIVRFEGVKSSAFFRLYQ